MCYGASMSLEAMTWAFKQPLSGHAKVILLAIADHANDEGECWPSLARIAKKASVSERTAQRYMLELADQGYLSTAGRNAPDGRTMTKKYFLHMEGLKEQGGEGDSLTPYGDTSVTGEGDTVVTPYEPSDITLKPNKQGTRVPENFTPDASCYELATRLGVSEPQFQSAFDNFMDYWRGVPGAKGRKLDWQGTFRNSLRKFAEFSPKGKTHGTGPRKSPNSIANGLEMADAVIDEIERRQFAASQGGGGFYADALP